MKRRKILVMFLVIVLLCLGVSAMAVNMYDFLPQAYDLRNVDGQRYITAVKSQCVPDQLWNSVGLCWAFSSIASFESSLLKQGIVTDSESPEANLSPWHLGCYVGYNHPNYDFNDSPVGNPPIPIGYQLDSTMQFGWGGSALFTVDWLATGKGLVLEDQAPLPLDRMRARETLIPPQEDLPTHYMLRKGLVYERQDYASDEEYRNVIKAALMKYGAVASPMFLGPPDFPGQIGESFWRDDNYTDYYCDSEELVNSLVHLVAIAGWDDTREIDNAPAPGAWLIKDSMGHDFHDEGYFWISYYDTVFLKGYSYSVILVADSGIGYDPSRYQTYESALSRPVTGSSMYESDGYDSAGLDSWACARFTGTQDGFLKAVGLVTVNNNEQVAINIFSSWDESEQMPCGLILSDVISVEEKGYHVIDLSQMVRVVEGEEFVIAIGFSFNPSGSREPLVFVLGEEHLIQPGRTYRTSFSADSGFGEWVDYTDIREHSVFFVQGIMSKTSQ